MYEIQYKHSVPVQLRFNDIDSLGHVNNSIYFSFYDLGKIRYFSTVRPEMKEIRDIDLVVANVNANFLMPIFLQENVSVQTTTVSIGNKSVKLAQQIVNDSGDIKAVCETILVGFDFKSGETKLISDEWRRAIEAYEGRTYAR
ncbi:MAG: acyl-CoA thioesterase [Coprobacter sp.]|nr:acyl-CoA thioesterase [Coprobacter sp.]